MFPKNKALEKTAWLGIGKQRKGQMFQFRSYIFCT